MKLFERIPRVREAVMANGGYFFWLLCYFIVLMSSLLFYSVKINIAMSRCPNLTGTVHQNCQDSELNVCPVPNGNLCPS